MFDLTEEAIEAGCVVGGLGVSVASKHLRMLQPRCFALLDEVLSGGFGFALNRKGFALFLRELHTLLASLKEQSNGDIDVATLKAGLFMLAHQATHHLLALLSRRVYHSMEGGIEFAHLGLFRLRQLCPVLEYGNAQRLVGLPSCDS